VSEVSSNRFVQALAKYCGTQVLTEKWVLAPSLRVGHQWLESVARQGRPVLNAHVKSLQNLALELAAAEFQDRGLTFLGRTQREVLAARLFAELRDAGEGYLASLSPSLSLTRTLTRTLEDLRLAGLSPERVDPKAFEVPDKGREIRSLLSRYESELEGRRLVDYAGILELARRQVSSLPEDVLIIAPEDLLEGLRANERALWQAIPASQRLALDVDRPGSSRKRGQSDSALLGWISDPTEAPSPQGDGTARIFRAVGEVNEVREVLRRCLREGISFDDVEILYTEADTYLPLIYELASSLGEPEAIPVTLAEGIPVRYSRPGRALMGWLTWQRDGYPQATLAWMIQDGLLRVPSPAQVSFSRLAAAFRAVPIGMGADRYLRCLDDAVTRLERRREYRLSDQEDEEATAGQLTEMQAGIDALNAVRAMVAPLLAVAAEHDGTPTGLLGAAKTFLGEQVRSASELDSYAQERLLREISDLSDCLVGQEPEGIDVFEWLSELPTRLRVLGQGPRPGHLYAAPIFGGGHSGRRDTFVVGLDDSRYPGGLRQEPLLLDAERTRVSEDLSTSARELDERSLAFARLMARARGAVTLSYCCRSLTDDRVVFPSPVIWSAYRILSGNTTGAYDDLLAWLPMPVSFAPVEPESCVDESDWWRWRLCGDTTVSNAAESVSHRFPHLGRGFSAAQARASETFTEYDGYVPEAGEDLDPRRPAAPAVSASRLELMGACPLDYFFRYALDIGPPDDLVLLHDVFRDFMCRLREEGLSPDIDRDSELMASVVEAHVKQATEAKPPPSQEVFQRDLRELRQSAAIFLREEELQCQGWDPFCFEASIGLPSETDSPLDTTDPIAVTLPDGTSIRTRARIDRIDRLRTDVSSLAVWDYKTGSTYGFDEANPFADGRRIQNVLYLMVTQARIEQVHPGYTVNSFGYFFASTRRGAYGERVQWPAELLLLEGKEVVNRLCRLIAGGCFPFTPNPGDARYSDYALIHGDAQALAEAVARKIANPENAMLDLFREMRGL
jgi:ATP-dependent helicase/nuclease subunit B